MDLCNSHAPNLYVRSLGFEFTQGPLNIEIVSYQYRDSRQNDEAVVRPSHLYNANSYTRKDGLHFETFPVSLVVAMVFGVMIKTEKNDSNRVSSLTDDNIGVDIMIYMTTMLM